MCLTQDLGIKLTALIVLTLIRYSSYLLLSTFKGEMRMENFATHVSLFASTVLETIWAVGVSYMVGTSLFPIVHKIQTELPAT